MFWSLVRPDRILLPITRSAAVTASLEADELAVGMITCEIGADSWSSTLIKRRRRPFFGPLHKLTTPLAWRWGGGSKKFSSTRARGRGCARPLLQIILPGNTIVATNFASE